MGWYRSPLPGRKNRRPIAAGAVILELKSNTYFLLAISIRARGLVRAILRPGEAKPGK